MEVEVAEEEEAAEAKEVEAVATRCLPPHYSTIDVTPRWTPHPQALAASRVDRRVQWGRDTAFPFQLNLNRFVPEASRVIPLDTSKT